MKVTLIILLVTLSLVPVVHCGIGGLPAALTFDSVGPGRPSTRTKESAHPAVAGGVDPGQNKTKLPVSRGHRPRLQSSTKTSIFRLTKSKPL